MARTPSNMVNLKSRSPEFKLKEPEGVIVDSRDFVGKKPFLVMFICNHCPYVVHIRKELGQVTKELMDKGLLVFGINSNDVVNYPDDSPEKMIVEKKKSGWTFPYLFDETQKVAKDFQAACTPDFFLYDRNGLLAYRGQFDSSRPNSGIPVTGVDLKRAAEDVLAGKEVSAEGQQPSLGCNIKWK